MFHKSPGLANTPVLLSLRWEAVEDAWSRVSGREFKHRGLILMCCLASIAIFKMRETERWHYNLKLMSFIVLKSFRWQTLVCLVSQHATLMYFRFQWVLWSFSFWFFSCCFSLGLTWKTDFHIFNIMRKETSECRILSDVNHMLRLLHRRNWTDNLPPHWDCSLWGCQVLENEPHENTDNQRLLCRYSNVVISF